MNSDLPSVFDVRDGDRIAPVYAVPGTPVTIRVLSPDGAPRFDVFENGEPAPALQAELIREFAFANRSARSLHEIGHRVRARYN